LRSSGVVFSESYRWQEYDRSDKNGEAPAMRNRWTLLFVLMQIAGFCGAATAQTADQQRCSAPDPDLAISGCTAMIQSGHKTQQDLVKDFSNRGTAYGRKGQYDRAIEDFDQAIRLNPNYAEAFNYRGANYARKFQLDRAIEDFDKAIRLNPNFAEAFSNRGNAYRRKGQLDRAIEDLDHAIRLNPNYAQAFYNRGTAYDRKAQPDRAIEDFDQAIRLNPNYAAALLDRGNEYRTQGDLDRAIADYSEFIRLNPQLTFVLLNRGVAYYYAGSLPKALADLNQLSEANPKGAYTALWLDIVNKRSNLASRLQQAVAQIDMTNWPAPVIRLFLGQMTPAAVLAAADDTDTDTKKSHICDAHFYTGELALLRDAKEEAVQLFKAAAESCPKTFVGDGAVSELKRLAQ
jgi:lipoprotein NlpI